MWVEFKKPFLWRNPHVPVTQYIPAGKHFVKRELGLAAIKDGHAVETLPPRHNGQHSA